MRNLRTIRMIKTAVDSCYPQRRFGEQRWSLVQIQGHSFCFNYFCGTLRLSTHCCGFNERDYYSIKYLSLKYLLAPFSAKGHAVPCAAETEIKRTVSVSQRLRSKDKARCNRWNQTDGGKHENNDPMSASMTGSQLSTLGVWEAAFCRNHRKMREAARERA